MSVGIVFAAAAATAEKFVALPNAAGKLSA